MATLLGVSGYKVSTGNGRSHVTILEVDEIASLIIIIIIMKTDA